MNILLVTDGSPHSVRAAQLLRALELPAATPVQVLSVIPEPTFLGGISMDVIRGISKDRRRFIAEQEARAADLVTQASDVLQGSAYHVTPQIRWGNPKQVVLDEADELESDLIIMGAKGVTDSPAFRLGGVALAVMKHARASVLLARKVVEVRPVADVSQEIRSLKRLLFANVRSRSAVKNPEGRMLCLARAPL